MYVHHVVVAELHAHLAYRLQERQRFDVAHGTADLHQGNVGIARAQQDAAFDLVGDVRNHLHRGAEIITAPFFADHIFVNPPGGKVIALAQGGAHEALVVAEIQIGLGTVVGHVDLAVLIRTHGARIDVNVGIEFKESDFQAAGLEYGREGGGCYPLAQGRDDAASNKNKFGHEFRCVAGSQL